MSGPTRRAETLCSTLPKPRVGRPSSGSTQPDDHSNKARIVIRDDLQKVNNAQNVYVATLTSKIFRMMMTLVVDFHFKIKQLNVVNVFLNVFNDEKIYCHMSNKYKQLKKILKLLRALYDQRKSFLL
jgi:hypothetical protein